MRTSLIAAVLALSFCRTSALAQDKVAEGEYAMQITAASGAVSLKTATRWTLYRKSPGGYRLRSEILGPPDLQGRLFQVEELDDKLVPTALGMEAYLTGQKRPIATLNCDFANGSITCHMQSEEGAFTCKPYKHNGPFWFWVENLFVLDLPWLTGGAANMAHLEKGKVPIAVVTFAGGGKNAACDLTAEEEGPLEFVETANLEVAGVEVAAKHYTMKSGEEVEDLWISNSGLLLKMSDRKEEGDFVLANYRQFKKLIPELPAESDKNQAAPPARPR